MRKYYLLIEPVSMSLNEELEGMNYRCQNLHYYLDLLSIPYQKH